MWDLLEGHKNPAPLSWAWFGAVKMERKPLAYEESHRLLKFHTHSLVKPTSYFHEPLQLPPEDLDPLPEKQPKDEKADTPSSVDQSPVPGGRARGKGIKRARKPKATNATNQPQNQPGMLPNQMQPNPAMANMPNQMQMGGQMNQNMQPNMMNNQLGNQMQNMMGQNINQNMQANNMQQYPPNAMQQGGQMMVNQGGMIPTMMQQQQQPQQQQQQQQRRRRQKQQHQLDWVIVFFPLGLADHCRVVCILNFNLIFIACGCFLLNQRTIRAVAAVVAVAPFKSEIALTYTHIYPLTRTGTLKSSICCQSPWRLSCRRCQSLPVDTTFVLHFCDG